jgi:hypothetical protein
VSAEESTQLRDIERLLGRKLPLRAAPDGIKPLQRAPEPVPAHRPPPRRNPAPAGRGGQHRTSRNAPRGQTRGAV